MSARFDVLIVGSGHGGAQAAIALRQHDFTGSIAMAGEEPDLPYERPPLSKEYLAGEKDFERLLIRPAGFWEERQVTMLPGMRVVSVDAAARRVQIEDGTEIGYGDLVWAAGGVPRLLSCAGGDLAGVHSVRSRADVDRMIGELPATRRAVVIGGGYIGLEAAAILTKAGKRVTVLEAADRLLARVSSAPLSRFFEAEHRRRGVDVRLNVTVDCIEARDGAAVGVRLADGTILPANIVIVGIGIDPCIAPLRAAGAAVGAAGVIVDAFCRTSLEDVYAVGDCVEFANPFAGGASLRLESVQNATDQGSVAAKAIIAVPEPYAAIPWFWSEQYDFRLQTVGIALGHDQIVVRGDADAPGFSLLYLKDGKVIALDCLSNVKDYVQGRMLINSGKIVSPDRLADCALPLKTLAA